MAEMASSLFLLITASDCQVLFRGSHGMGLTKKLGLNNDLLLL